VFYSSVYNTLSISVMLLPIRNFFLFQIWARVTIWRKLELDKPSGALEDPYIRPLESKNMYQGSNFYYVFRFWLMI